MSARLNVSRLPSGSGAQFLSLVATTIMATIVIGQYFGMHDHFATYVYCVFHPGCIASTSNGIVALPLICILSCTFYIIHPWQQAKSFGEYETLKDPDPLRAAVLELASTMGTRVDRVLVDRDILNNNALAFGIWKQQTVLLGRGFYLMLKANPGEFQARMGHELGHIKNGDVSLAFWARGIVFAFGLFAITTAVNIVGSTAWHAVKISLFLLSSLYAYDYFWTNQFSVLKLFYEGEAFAFVTTIPIVVFFSLIVFLEYRAFLRIREILADAQATLWVDGRIVEKALSFRYKPNIYARFASYCNVISAHPSQLRRIRAIREPHEAGCPTYLRLISLGYIFMLVPSLLLHAIDIVSHSFDIFTIYSNMTKIADPGFGILSFKSWMAIVLGDLIVYSYLCVFLLTMIRFNFASVLALDSSLKRFVK
jgi:Zn-dependent protease with chaperone function